MSSRPSKRTDPRLEPSSPVSAAHSVDLPMPLRPITATGSSPIEKLTSWSTCDGP